MNSRLALLNRLVKAKDDGGDSYGYPHVELFFWKPEGSHLNFGDHLARVIVTKLLAAHGHVLEEETAESRRLFAVGSVLHFAEDNDVVWGSGVNGKIDPAQHRFRTLDVRAVRGPLTRNFLMERGIAVPEIYGDPALLLPMLFPERFARHTQSPYVVVPNLHDLKLAQDARMRHIVSPILSWNRCVTEILKGELVISSSLHGIIIAEAYGIPARYLRLSDTENIFKYNDYMLGTGRTAIEPAESVEEALEMGGMPPPVFDPEALLAAFPIDLWSPLD
jgi:pyruvyltransferase